MVDAQAPGLAGMVRSLGEIMELKVKLSARNTLSGKVVELSKGERHRLIGEATWGIVAEIWVHTDPNSPSDESDIVRLQDDYSRK